MGLAPLPSPLSFLPIPTLIPAAPPAPPGCSPGAPGWERERNLNPRSCGWGWGWLEETEGTLGRDFPGTLNRELTVLPTRAELTWVASPFPMGGLIYPAVLVAEWKKRSQAQTQSDPSPLPALAPSLLPQVLTGRLFN